MDGKAWRAAIGWACAGLLWVPWGLFGHAVFDWGHPYGGPAQHDRAVMAVYVWIPLLWIMTLDVVVMRLWQPRVWRWATVRRQKVALLALAWVWQFPFLWRAFWEQVAPT